MPEKKISKSRSKHGRLSEQNSKPDPDQRSKDPSPENTNVVHASTPGTRETAPGVGVVGVDSDISTHKNGPGHDVADARTPAPGAQRVGTTEGRSAAAARGGIKTGLEDMEAPSSLGQTAYAGNSEDAPGTGSSGIRATSDPNFIALRADEEGTPSREALAEQAASMGKQVRRK